MSIPAAATAFSLKFQQYFTVLIWYTSLLDCSESLIRLAWALGSSSDVNISLVNSDAAVSESKIIFRKCTKISSKHMYGHTKNTFMRFCITSLASIFIHCWYKCNVPKWTHSTDVAVLRYINPFKISVSGMRRRTAWRILTRLDWGSHSQRRKKILLT